MQTHKITLSYPTSGLTVNVEIRNRTTNAVLESGVAVENGTTATYDYDFDGTDNTDYIYIASVSGLNDIKGAVFYEAASGGGGGGATVADIWSAQISDYSGSAGSFANKFEQYGGVSHVIDRSSLDESSKLELKGMKDKLDEFSKAIKNIKSTDGEFEKIVKLLKEQTNKTTVVKSQGQYDDIIGASLTAILDKLDEATGMIPIYEDIINYLEQRDKDWEKLVEDIINNN